MHTWPCRSVRKPFVLLSVLALTAALAIPAAATAQQIPGAGPDDTTLPDETLDEDELDELMDEDVEDERPWSVSMSLRSMVGQGTFVSPANDSEWAGQVDDGSGAYNRWNLVYNLAPSYQIGDFRLGLSLSWVQWLTEGGGVGATSISGGANRAREFRFQDVTGSVGWKSYTQENFGVTITPGLSVRLPGSVASRNQSLIADVSGSLSFTRQFMDDLTLTAGVSGSQAFHEFTSAVVDVEAVGVDNALFRPGGAEDVAPGRFAIGGLNTKYALVTSLSASLSLPSDFSASMSYSMNSFWTYRLENAEEFSGEHVRGDRGFAQVTASSLGVSYRVNQWASTSLSFVTLQPPKTSDNSSYRFPFWNFSSPASNYSSVNFAVTGTY